MTENTKIYMFPLLGYFYELFTFNDTSLNRYYQATNSPFNKILPFILLYIYVVKGDRRKASNFFISITIYTIGRIGSKYLVKSLFSRLDEFYSLIIISGVPTLLFIGLFILLNEKYEQTY